MPETNEKKELLVNGGYPLHSFNDLKEILALYIFEKKDHDFIKKAYEYALKKHEGVYRKTGEEYIHHPLEVCYILALLKVDPVTIVAGFLHDVVEDTDTKIEEIGKEFGKEVQSIVDPLTKIQRLKLSHKDKIHIDAEDHKKIFIGMASDIRVILIKLADRLHNMRTVDSLSDERIEALSKETLEVYAPIAHRLGIYSIQSELEDLSIKHLRPLDYKNYSAYLDKHMKNRKKTLESLKKNIADLLLKHNFKDFTISSRVKSIYSIYKKVNLKGHSLNEIYDILAIRVITNTEIECYEALGLIHTIYKPVPGRFKDYIAVPKANMYQSLHTTIITQNNEYFEVQIRTKEMDRIAESGVAAHWQYKEGNNKNVKQRQHEIENKLNWFHDFVNLIKDNKKKDAKEAMDNIKNDVFDVNVYCLTPMGKVIDLPAGATVLDFAYKIHTKIGDKAAYATINNKEFASLNTVLKNGDIVDIKTNPNTQPNEGWLKIAKSSSAIGHIKKFLAKKNENIIKEEKAAKGKNSLLEFFKNFDIKQEELISLIENKEKKVLDNYKCDSINDLYILIANKTLAPNSIANFLNLKPKQEIKLDKVKSNNNKSPVLIGGQDDIAVNLGSCCTPIPGDEIVGYITKGKGITIHRIECPNIANERDRLIDAQWKLDLEKANYPVDILIEANDRANLLTDIMGLVSKRGVSISAVNAKLIHNTLNVNITMTIHVADSDALKSIFNVILNVEGVFSIKRVIH